VLGATLPVLRGSITSGTGTAMVRPEALSLAPDAAGVATVTSVAFLGPFSRVHCVLGDGTPVSAQMSSSSAREFRVGDRVRVDVERAGVLVVPG